MINQNTIINIVIIVGILYIVNKILKDKITDFAEDFLKGKISDDFNYLKPVILNTDEYRNIIQYLEKNLEQNNRKINNVSIKDKLIYYVNSDNSQISFRPFKIIGNIYEHNKLRGIISLTLECKFIFSNEGGDIIENKKGKFVVKKIYFTQINNKHKLSNTDMPTEVEDFSTENNSEKKISEEEQLRGKTISDDSDEFSIHLSDNSTKKVSFASL